MNSGLGQTGAAGRSADRTESIVDQQHPRSWLIDRDVVVLHDATLLCVHSRSQCTSFYCVIHHPSDHPLNSAPLHWESEQGLMYRICSHQRAHPDPDAYQYATLLALVSGRGTTGLMPSDEHDDDCDCGCCWREDSDDSNDADKLAAVDVIDDADPADVIDTGAVSAPKAPGGDCE